MKKGKKYDCRITQDGAKWTAEIIRRASSKKTVVSKKQAGFASEAEAKTWGETELKLFLENLVKQNKLRAEEHKKSTPHKFVPRNKM